MQASSPPPARRLGAAVLLSLAACSAAPDVPRRPDVLVVVVDTLRADRLPFYGADDVEAPFLTGLADAGLVFDGAWSTSSWTAPAAASLFTSLYPPQHGVHTGLRVTATFHGADPAVRLNRMPPQVETLPEVLRDLGYRTFGAVDNPTVCAEMGFGRGFDRFVQLDYEGAEALNDVVRSWRGELRASDAPTFLYVHYMDPHAPYHAREPWFEPEGEAAELWDELVAHLGEAPLVLDGEAVAVFLAERLVAEPDVDTVGRAQALALEAYDSEVAWLDRRMAELFEVAGVDRETLVVFTADHGEEFGEHGHTGHGVQVYGELLNVPLVLRLPGAEAPRGRVARPASLVDVLPTLRRYLTGASAPQDAGLDLLAPVPADRAQLAWRTNENPSEPAELSAIRLGDWKAVFREPDGSAELYDLAEDPGEARDVAAEHPAMVARLRAEFERRRRALPAYERSFTDPVQFDPETVDALERLGYVDGRDGAGG